MEKSIAIMEHTSEPIWIRVFYWPVLYSSYDQVPMDHNRTALPVLTLAQVMKNDRMWFLSLDPESQALVLSELLTVAGGPAMWEMLRRARRLYDRYRENMLSNLQECIVVNDSPYEKTSTHQSPVDKTKKEQTSRKGSAEGGTEALKSSGEAQKELDASLLTWNATMKAMRDSLKLEEIEMTFTDGTKRKIWKVNRPKPEVIETVDFLQLLPSSIGKKIISYLPRTQLGDYARVNKYWAYLVDEFRAELTARTKINVDFDRLHDMLLRHDTSLELFISPNQLQTVMQNSQGIASATPSAKMKLPHPSVKASEKSGGAYSMRPFLTDKLVRPVINQKPIRNMADLNERLERRGAADENIWKWCECVLAHARKIKKCKLKRPEDDGVLSLGNVHFPCPLMKMSMEIPLIPPLYRDPIMSTASKPRKNLSDCTFVHVPKETIKRYSLWTRDLSSLYPVFKIPSYQSPI